MRRFIAALALAGVTIGFGVAQAQTPPIQPQKASACTAGQITCKEWCERRYSNRFDFEACQYFHPGGCKAKPQGLQTCMAPSK